MTEEKILVEMEMLFMALADKTRLRLLNLMRGGEICVCFFVEVLGESQPKISRHLAYLRNAGIVETRRDGKWMNYKIVEPESAEAAKVLRATLDWLGAQERMQTEYKTLTAACCSPNAPVGIIRRPKSDIFVETNMTKEKNYRREDLDTFLL